MIGKFKYIRENIIFMPIVIKNQEKQEISDKNECLPYKHVFNLVKDIKTGIKYKICYKCGYKVKADTQKNQKVFKSEGKTQW